MSTVVRGEVSTLRVLLWGMVNKGSSGPKEPVVTIFGERHSINKKNQGDHEDKQRRARESEIEYVG